LQIVNTLVIQLRIFKIIARQNKTTSINSHFPPLPLLNPRPAPYPFHLHHQIMKPETTTIIPFFNLQNHTLKLHTNSKNSPHNSIQPSPTFFLPILIIKDHNTYCLNSPTPKPHNYKPIFPICIIIQISN
jgi:hypothetical protein